MLANLAKKIRSSHLAILAASLLASSLNAQELVDLSETRTAGRQFRVRTRGDLHGNLNLPAQNKDASKPGQSSSLKLNGSSATDYDEVWLQVDQSTITKLLRSYREQDYRRQLGTQRQQSSLRPEARRVVIIPRPKKSFIFSPDGPLTLAEIETTQLDLLTPHLSGLLPKTPQRAGGTWQADRTTIEELTDMTIEEGTVSCRLLTIEQRGGQQHAVASFQGTVSGHTQDGPSRQKVDGTFSFNLQDRFLSELSLSATSWMLDSSGREVGRIDGRYVITRRLINQPELDLNQLRQLTLEPNERNTEVLVDEPALGIRLLHPRHWTVTQADGRQIMLDDGQGAGLLFTLEPPRQIPTAAQFQNEAKAALEKQKLTLSRSVPIRRLLGEPSPLDHFRLEAATPQQKQVVLDYFVYKQRDGGATIAANYPATRIDEVAREIERIVRSLQLTPPKK